MTKRVSVPVPTIGAGSTVAVGALIATDTVQTGGQITGLVIVAIAALTRDVFVAYFEHKNQRTDSTAGATA